MIGIVVVSHSRRLAEGICEVAGQMAQGRARLAAAGGTGESGETIGTDAFRVLEAIEAVYSDDGVMVFCDLGSAVMSAETAIELVEEGRRGRIHLSRAPAIEGAVAAAAQAAAGAPWQEILGETREVVTAPAEAGGETRTVTVGNAQGVHARPAAQLIRIARKYRARVTLENVSEAAGPFDAISMHGILALSARQGHEVRLRASGEDAGKAIEEIASFLAGQEKAGAAAAPGIAIGPLARWRQREARLVARTVADVATEETRLMEAIRGAREETRELYEWARGHAGQAEADIFDAQMLYLEDPGLIERAAQRVRERQCDAAFAWDEATTELRAQAGDAVDLRARVLRRLMGAEASSGPPVPDGAILTAFDLSPAQVRGLDASRVRGVLLEAGGAGAHATILARAIGIPVITGLGAAIGAVAEGTIVAMDGASGELWIEPDEAVITMLESRREVWAAGQRAAEANRGRPAATRDGRVVRVFANIGAVAEAAEAVERGAEGVGVLRTEFLFLDRSEAPGEDEQFEAYRAIARALDGRPLVIRTLDAGGDKPLPYVEIGEEANPFLGWRGIRVSLGRIDLFRTQLRAIVRAAAEADVRVLLPMIAAVDEVRIARALLRELSPERKIALGAMIEVPAAVAIAGDLAREADFFSIGTNDLIQYLMAADRTNPRVAYLADPLQPAVLRSIRQTVEAAHAAQIDVTLCGELAGDAQATAVLLGLGIDEFSVSAPLIPEVKRAIAGIAMSEAEEAARRATGLLP